MAVILEELSQSVAKITIDYPLTLNSLSSKIVHELSLVIHKCNENNSRVVIITGAGRSFVAGADISSMVQMNEDDAKSFSLAGSYLFREIECSSKVFIAAINGYALGGGCELALACDIRIASEKAKFGLPEVSLGIMPGFSGIRRLTDIVGESKAKELVFTGRTIDAFEAKEIGLVNKITPVELLMQESTLLADTIAAKSFSGVSKSKKCFNLLKSGDIEIAIKNCSELFASCFLHPDQKEGMDAFLNKRTAVFSKKQE